MNVVVMTVTLVETSTGYVEVRTFVAPFDNPFHEAKKAWDLFQALTNPESPVERERVVDIWTTINDITTNLDSRTVKPISLDS